MTGGGDPARFGLIALATDLAVERDGARLVPPEAAALHVTRVAFTNPTTPANLAAMAPRLGDAAAMLVPGTKLAAIGYACTSASAVLGEAAVAEAIGVGRPGVPVVTPISAAIAAFRALGTRRVGVMTPYLDAAAEPVEAYLAAAGLELVATHRLQIADDRDIARLPPAEIVAGAIAADRPDAQAIFLSCTALPALRLVAHLEAHLGKPVVTSNQALFWGLLGHAGMTLPAGFGRLTALRREAAA